MFYINGDEVEGSERLNTLVLHGSHLTETDERRGVEDAIVRRPLVGVDTPASITSARPVELPTIRLTAELETSTETRPQRKRQSYQAAAARYFLLSLAWELDAVHAI